jgi:SAM-dependent methyltransferase
MASGQRQAELWGPSARLWAEKHEAYSLGLAEWLLDRVLTQPGQKLLDAGCGTGGALKIALARGARVTGTDVAPEMLEICRERVPQGEYFVADSEALPFVDGTFDAIIAQNSFAIHRESGQGVARVRASEETRRADRHCLLRGNGILRFRNGWCCGAQVVHKSAYIRGTVLAFASE